jgi:IS30 family transposase
MSVPLADAAIKALKPIKAMIETITLDNGLEFSGHKRIAKSIACDLYFAHPYSSWERVINENTNGLIRQYFPKGTDFNQVTDKQVKQVMEKLNNRPRKTRCCQSPNELFNGLRKELLAA